MSHSYEKPLAALLAHLGATLQGSAQTRITDIVFDSRRVTPGALYVAMPGTRVDGHEFIAQAVRSGAAAIMVQRPVAAVSVPVVTVPSTLKALTPVSMAFWDNPSRRLAMIGVTGTNGKTTTTYLVESILRAAGWSPAVLGTVEYRFGTEKQPAPNTTPYASDLHRFLARVADGRGDACVMEVSSHALALGRVDGILFDVGVFTNLTQDHLDFHGTMEAYAAAKATLFSGLGRAPSGKRWPASAILNREDRWFTAMRQACAVPVRTYALSGDADLIPRQLICDAQGSRFELTLAGGPITLALPLLGDYNVANALAAAGAAEALGIPREAIRRGLEDAPGVPGRLEVIREGQPFTVVVDYAHTDDALKHVLATMKKLGPGRLITIFGCGGDRDRTKRPLMGETAARWSDEVIVTSDNPRSEDPKRIMLDVEVGIRRVRSDHYEIHEDRQEAIARAIDLAQPGDIVVLAGKGHETVQIVGDRRLPFDDRDVARRLLRQRFQTGTPPSCA